ncbi:hypothetical protein SNE40_000215 [Patella caerulea]|uniref:Uncharacterized protein n=1 Tax=Patella caerulea TaxID=87958 RepID=A0AAN8KA18_PATCE
MSRPYGSTELINKAPNGGVTVSWAWPVLHKMALFHLAPGGLAVMMGIITMYEIKKDEVVVNFNTAAPLSIGLMSLLSGSFLFIECFLQFRNNSTERKISPLLWFHFITEILTIALCLWTTLWNASGLCISEIALTHKCTKDEEVTQGHVLAVIDFVIILCVCVYSIICFVIKLHYRHDLGLAIATSQLLANQKQLESQMIHMNIMKSSKSRERISLKDENCGEGYYQNGSIN